MKERLHKIMQTNIKKLIVEQIVYPPCDPVDPPTDFTDEEWAGSGRPPVRSGCAPCKKGTKISIRCKASVQPPIDDKYVGVYVKKGFGIIQDFKVKFKQFRNQLKMTMGGGQYVLTKSTNTEDVFWNQTFGIDVTFDFTEDPPQAIINLSTPNASVLTTLEGANVVRLMAPPPVGQGSEITVTKTDESVNPAAEDSAVWNCVKTALDNSGAIMMGTSLKGDYKYFPVDTIYEGEETDFYLYKNYKAEWKTSDSMKTIKTGKWECTENNKGFKITWDDGKVEKFPVRARISGDENEDNNQDDGSDGGENQSKIKNCRSFVTEPNEKDILSGRKQIKKCMKGPIIASIQKMPVFQSYLFDVLRGNKQPEVTDEFFGPYMEKAIKIYQSTNGLYSLNRTLSGTIDKKTYELLLSQNKNRPGPEPEPPKPAPKPEPKPAPAPEPPKPKFADEKTKF